MEAFDGPLGVRAATEEDLQRRARIPAGLAGRIARFFRSPGLADADRRADRALAVARREGAAIIDLWSPGYPDRLAQISAPPPVLFVLGSTGALNRVSIAIVGTRRPTTYGLEVAAHFAGALGAAGAVVVSGLARGIDTRAHLSALDAGGTTVAVIGTGPEGCYPPENSRLKERIAGGGAVVTEFPPGTEPEPSNFPRRNRIISGLSLGTIVVESGIDGGAMITAYLALDQNREVFAVPGNIRSGRSAGCHALLRRGNARLVTSPAEVLEDLGLPPGPEGGGGGTAGGSDAGLSAAERAVARLVGADPVHLEDLAVRSDLPVADLLGTLLLLEIKDVVRQLPGKYFVRPFR